MSRKTPTYRGYPIMDASTSIRIHTKQCDIMNASRDNHNHCVFARTMLRQYGVVAEFNGTIARVFQETYWLRYELPSKTSKAIFDFDDTGEAKEGSFLLRPPCNSHKLEELAKTKESAKYKRRRKQLKSGDPSTNPAPRPRNRHFSSNRSGRVIYKRS